MKSMICRIAGAGRGSGTHLCVGIAAVLCSVPAQGQDASYLEEIVVTATKRTESAQDVSMSISAVGAAQLGRMGADGFEGYARSIPSLSLIEKAPGRNKVIIRGINDGPNTGTAATTGIYFDETPVTANNANPDLHLYDVERIEVLRGPQGTLYGSGSMGGTVRIITNKPDFDAVHGGVDLLGSSTHRGGENYSASGFVNLPLASDWLALRAVGYYRSEDGFIDDPQRGKQDVNDEQTRGGRLVLRAAPSDALNVLATVAHQRTDVGALPQSDLALPPYQQARSIAEQLRSEWTLYSLQVDYDLGGAQLVSASSYFNMETPSIADFTPLVNGALRLSPPIPAPIINAGERGAFSQELRLASTGDTRFGWLGGVFYSRDENDTRQVDDASDIRALFGGRPLIDGTVNTELEQYAAFGELSYDLSDRLEATIGARWSRSSIEQVTNATGVLVGGQRIESGDASASKETLKFLLSYKLGENHLVYAQAAEGFRLGGPNGLVPQPLCTSALVQLGLNEAPEAYAPDSLWNYEIGAKNTWLGGRLIVNAAAFYIDWQNIQVRRILSCGFSFTDNSGGATSKGGELEIVVQPLAGLQLKASAGYTDTEITKTVATVGAIDGDPLPNVPEWTYSAALQYTRALNSALDVFVRGDYQHVGSSLNDFSGLGPASVTQPAYDIATFRLGLQGDAWEASVFANNAFDERAQTFTQIAAIIPHQIVNRPRTVGVNFKWSF